MNTEIYEKALIEELEKLLSDYENRIKENQGTQHKNLSTASVVGMIGTGAAVGGAVGTAIPIPVAGSAIGATAVTALVLGVAGIIEAHYYRMNKKIDNAATVIDFFGDNKYERKHLIKKAAHKIIKDRQDILNKVHYSEKANKQIAAYLAANMMAAIKHNPDASHKIRMITGDLQDTRSRKVSDRAVEDNNALRLKDIAQFKR